MNFSKKIKLRIILKIMIILFAKYKFFNKTVQIVTKCKVNAKCNMKYFKLRMLILL